MEADTSAAMGLILHLERLITTHPDHALHCLMYLPGICHGGAMGSMQGSRRGRGRERAEVNALVLASSQFAR